MDGEKVKVGSAEWKFYRSKLRFYQFLEDRITDPNVTNPLDLINWETFWSRVWTTGFKRYKRNIIHITYFS